MRQHHIMRRAFRRRAWVLDLLCLLLVTAIFFSLLVSPAAAASLERFLRKASPGELFPGTDEFAPPTGTPPIVPLLKTGREVGYAFLNSDFVNAVGYSGKPIHILIALDGDARITGLKLVDHKEPIVLIGIPERKITDVLDGYVGFDVADFARGERANHNVDIVSGATVTVMVIDDSILRAAIKAARHLGLGGLTPEPELDVTRREINEEAVAEAEWLDLLGDGTLRRLRLSVGDVDQAFRKIGDSVAADKPEASDPAETFIDLYGAVVSVPAVGRSLLGEAEYENLKRTLKPGQQAILLAADGHYSFKGSGYVRGGIFDRFQIIQGEESYRFRDRDHKRLGALHAVGTPKLREIDLFYTPGERNFDPARGWRLELLAQRATGPTRKSFLTFEFGYRLPERYLKPLAVPLETTSTNASLEASLLGGVPLWQRLWSNKIVEVVILVTALGALTVIFFIQDWLVKRPRATTWIRNGFLLFTLFGIGFYANAQLSIVNILTFFNSLVAGFSWEAFLVEPLIFILWFSVAAALLFWGRGPFCGWLCPFGALQELSNKLAKLAKVPQIAVPWWLHQRLWPIKYILFLVLFGISLHSLALAEQLAEVEPFKTAIILKFARAWPFVLYTLALLAAGLFIERFFCRYLCPLGAALAIPGRLRMFDWLLRYRECGNPCQRCAHECMVGAIHPEGHINPNECMSCLHCQTLYHDDRRCPVMIQRRLKRERRDALASKNGPGPTTPNKDGKPKLELADFLPE